MEALTQQMADAAWKIIEEIESIGSMTKAVQSGWAKLKIEASAAEKQARIDSGEDVIVGVNKYKLDEEALIDTLDIDNHAVRDNQVARLKALRAKRDPAAVTKALAALASRKAATAICSRCRSRHEARATVGEVSDALEAAWGRHRADTQKVSGIYAAAYDSAQGWDALGR